MFIVIYSTIYFIFLFLRCLYYLCYFTFLYIPGNSLNLRSGLEFKEFRLSPRSFLKKQVKFNALPAAGLIERFIENRFLEQPARLLSAKNQVQIDLNTIHLKTKDQEKHTSQLNNISKQERNKLKN